MTFCDPSINGSVHNSIYVCVGATMWKYRGSKDIKPFPLNIIWPYQSHSQEKAYVCICWKNAPSHCAVESLHVLPSLSVEMLHGSDTCSEFERERNEQKTTTTTTPWVFGRGNKLNFWKNVNAHLSINIHVGFCITCRAVWSCFLIHSCHSWI